MLQDLSVAVEELDIPLDGAALVEAFAVADRMSAKLAAVVAGFDAAGLWDLDGATSMTAWLRDRARMGGGDARRVTATAKRLSSLPVTAAAWADGSLSGGQVGAVVAATSPSTVALFAAHEADVVPTLVDLSVADTGRVMRSWKASAEAVVDGAAPREPDRSLRLSPLLDGSWALDGDLDSEGGQVVATALRIASTDDVDGEPARTPGERRADALVDVCRWYLGHQTTRRGGRHRPHVNVVVDLDRLQAGGGGRFVDGGPLDGPSVAAAVCDGILHRVLTSRSAVLDYGTATRSIPAPLWNALVVRDEHCRFPGCDRPAGWCEGHHVTPVADGGPTRIDNLALLCTRHHHRLHQPGWHVKLLPDATLETTDPAGQTRTSRPPGHLPW